mmetsp:Transcript_2207/g.2648  ORF Transcript_2207/g.2648 Transcript_2207/m.2648 type:complete len:322 (-) Transcript_2207:14-979(-)
MRKLSNQNSVKTPNDGINIKVEALGGLSAGIIGTVIGYPLDLVKTRMQTFAVSLPTHSVTTSSGATHNSVFRLGYTIIRNEGIASLYKGMTPPLISLTILNTCTFTSYNYIRNEFNAKRGFDYKNALAGISTAPFGGFISTVEHMIKTQMQLDNVMEKRYKGSLDCMKTLIQEHGFKVIYTGHAVNTVREGVFLGTYFYTYEGTRMVLQNVFHDPSYISPTLDGNKKAAAWTIPFAGGISGAWAWFVSFPLDCIKAGVQGQSLSSPNRKKSMQVFKELIQTKGWKGLYSGVTPSIMRAFIVSSSRFTAYEMVVKFCGDYLR